MIKKVLLAVVVVLTCLAPAMSASLPGTTETVFNRRFVNKLKPMMPYNQLARMIGQGQKVGEDRQRATAMYHWNGGRRSALDIAVAAGRVVNVTVTSPKKQKYGLGKKGELVEL